MKKLIIFFLLTISGKSALALIPIEGLVYGNVEDIYQYDPFVGMLNSNYTTLDKKEGSKKARLTRYIALYKQGMELVNQCDQTQGLKYADRTNEDAAIRSTIANLQYIGLDFTIRNIVNYAKILEIGEGRFENLSENLINNSCSQNISVFSHKMLKANFRHFWQHGTKLDIPSIQNLPYFNKQTKSFMNERKTIENAFYYSINSFRSLCSWGGSTDHVGLLAPYLRNPFLMSYVFNNMLEQRIDVDIKTEKVFFTKMDNSVQVSCDNLICRRKNSEDFKTSFPLINGSSNLNSDLKLIYCTHFQNARTKRDELTKEQLSWIEGHSRNDRTIEASNLFGQMAGIPNLFTSIDDYQQVSELLKGNIKERWDSWAEKKSSEFNIEQLYEESLEITLVEGDSNQKPELGEFSVDFRVELGELDKLLGDHNKLDASFDLGFSKSYIENLKERILFSYDKGNFKKVNSLRADFSKRINYQLGKKEKFFKVPLWNDRLGGIIANELVTQFLKQKRSIQSRLASNVIKIPVKFHFGVFALQYIRDKQKFKSEQVANVSLKQ